MPKNMDNAQIQSILQTLGERITTPSRLILIGGGALALLGSPRLTIDLDFIGDDLSPSPLHKAIMQAAKELDIYAEPVPLERFIPCLRAAMSAQFSSANSEIWKYTSPTLTALRSANWNVALTQTLKTLSFSFNAALSKWQNWKRLWKNPCRAPANLILIQTTCSPTCKPCANA